MWFKNTIIILFVCLSVVSKAIDKQTYKYQKTVFKYNFYTKQYDTLKQYFYIIKENNGIYLNNLSSVMNGGDTLFNYIGDFFFNKYLEVIWTFRGDTVKIYSVKDTINTHYDNQSKFLFLKGTVYNGWCDTTINDYKCIKFIRYFKGNPGRDIPNYIAEEYFDIEKLVIVYQKIKYSHPYKEIWINLIENCK